MFKFLGFLGGVLVIAQAVCYAFDLYPTAYASWHVILILLLPIISPLGVFCENSILRVIGKWISLLSALCFLFLIAILFNVEEYDPESLESILILAFIMLTTFLVGLGIFDSSISFFNRNTRRDEGLVSLWFRAKKYS